MSNWMLVILTASTVFQFLSALYCHRYKAQVKSSQQTPLLLQINWFFYDMATPVALFISVVYFSAVLTVEKGAKLAEKPVDE